MPELSENATLVERITYYVETDERRKAKALAKVGDYLEECWQWELEWDTTGLY